LAGGDWQARGGVSREPLRLRDLGWAWDLVDFLQRRETAPGRVSGRSKHV
jgi:hypothetical protein